MIEKNKSILCIGLLTAMLTNCAFATIYKSDILYVDFESSMGFPPEWNFWPKTDRASLSETQSFLSFLKALYEKNSLAKKNRKLLIPKIIHQIWLGPNTPPAIFAESQASIKKYLPDWDYKLWTDADVPALNLYNQKYYDLSNNYGERSDIIRYEILYKYGGLYLDVDFVLLKPFDILHHTYDFYTSLLPHDCQDTLANGAIGARAGHPILKDCIDTIEEDWLTSKNLIVRVGPFHFQKSFHRVAQWYKGPIIAFPKSYFFPINYNLRNLITDNLIAESTGSEAFAIHHYTHTWFKAAVNEVEEKIDYSKNQG